MTSEMFSFKNRAENKAGRIVPDLFLFLKKALYDVKANYVQISFNHFQLPSTWKTMKTKYIKI